MNLRLSRCKLQLGVGSSAKPEIGFAIGRQGQLSSFLNIFYNVEAYTGIQTYCVTTGLLHMLIVTKISRYGVFYKHSGLPIAEAFTLTTLPFPIKRAASRKITDFNVGVDIFAVVNYPVKVLIVEGGNSLEDLSSARR
nr:GDP-L-galactose phosphorylase [Tanacetum cinerariifolium]